MTRLAAVTGGTGFLGRHVLAAFAAAGWRVRLLARRDPGPLEGVAASASAAGAPVETVRGSLADRDALRALVDGADAVVHLAGAIKAPGRAAFMAVNRDGTAAVAETWLSHARPARFVLVSSLAAREPGLSHYAASKAAGEAALASAMRALSDDASCGGAVVLRPCAVYGPGDRETLGLFRAAGWPVQPVLNGPAARVALVHAADVAAAVLAAAGPGFPPGTFELSDERAEGYSWPEIATAACRACGRAARPVRVPAAALVLAGLCGDALALAGRATMLGSGKRREVLHRDWGSSPGRQPPAASWRPVRGVDAGFAETVAWYRAAGWLRGRPGAGTAGPARSGTGGASSDHEI